MRKKETEEKKTRRQKGRRFQTVPLPWFLGVSTIHDHREKNAIKFNVSIEGPKKESQIWRAIEEYPMT